MSTNSDKGTLPGSETPTVIVDRSKLGLEAEGAGTPPPEGKDGQPTANADGGTGTPPEGKEDTDTLPMKGGKTAKYVGLGALFLALLVGVAVMVAWLAGNAPTETARGSAPATGPTAPAAGPNVLPTVRIPAPRGIDASGCRRDQWSIEGNTLVFRNCATLELAEPESR